MASNHLSTRASDSGGHPPRPPFRLTVGVTGHRRAALPETDAALRRACRESLLLVEQAARATCRREEQWFLDDELPVYLLSPLADGADQITADTALDLGFELHALLPFAADRYRATLPDDPARLAYDAFVARAARILELPGDPQAEAEAYVMAGRATVAHADILLAVWDGEPARGGGGTAAVVELAIRRGVAVIHIDPQARQDPALLWSGFDPTVVTDAVGHAVRRPFDAEHLGIYFASLLAPPADPEERRFLHLFTAERMRRFRTRIEYPLLLAAAGVARFNPATMREAHCQALLDQEWDEFHRNCAACHQLEPHLDLLQPAYAWSDRLATRFAQSYRSGHIFNFVLGGTAVCFGLVANILSRFLLQFSLAEAAVTALILFNTRVGMRNEWHRRWLDYRQLAERLRPMRSLKLLALAAPDPPGTPANPKPRRWMEWYALATGRAMGCPSGSINGEEAASLAKSVAAYEVAPQIAYHRRHAHQIELLDHRLERISVTLFWITLVTSGLAVAGAALRPDLVQAYDPWLTLAGAGFPALGTAVFGVRFQADFGGSAVRSENTATALGGIEAELAAGAPLGRAAELAEQAARVMLADLDEWRLVNQQQELDLL